MKLDTQPKLPVGKLYSVLKTLFVGVIVCVGVDVGANPDVFVGVGVAVVVGVGVELKPIVGVSVGVIEGVRVGVTVGVAVGEGVWLGVQAMLDEIQSLQSTYWPFSKISLSTIPEIVIVSGSTTTNDIQPPVVYIVSPTSKLPNCDATNQ